MKLFLRSMNDRMRVRSYIFDETQDSEITKFKKLAVDNWEDVWFIVVDDVIIPREIIKKRLRDFKGGSIE